MVVDIANCFQTAHFQTLRDGYYGLLSKLGFRDIEGSDPAQILTFSPYLKKHHLETAKHIKEALPLTASYWTALAQYRWVINYEQLYEPWQIEIIDLLIDGLSQTKIVSKYGKPNAKRVRAFMRSFWTDYQAQAVNWWNDDHETDEA